jgi:hypothetical protein
MVDGDARMATFLYNFRLSITNAFKYLWLNSAGSQRWIPLGLDRLPWARLKKRTSVVAMARIPWKFPNDSATEGRNFRDDGARALRAVFSWDDNWPNLSEVERDEWRAYFARMLEWLHHLQSAERPKRGPTRGSRSAGASP